MTSPKAAELIAAARARALPAGKPAAPIPSDSGHLERVAMASEPAATEPGLLSRLLSAAALWAQGGQPGVGMRSFALSWQNWFGVGQFGVVVIFAVWLIALGADVKSVAAGVAGAGGCLGFAVAERARRQQQIDAAEAIEDAQDSG